MSTSTRLGLHACVSVLGLSVLACGDRATSPRAQDDAASLVSSRSANLAAGTFAGRIVYTTGTLHIYDLSTATDVSLGVSGVNPKFSPDGTLITYQNTGIWVVNADGTNKRVLSAVGGTPSFDPTGTMIAFGNNGIWKINVDGSGLKQLTTTGLQPAWSPDGTQIAYDAAVSKSQQLFIVNADGTNPHRVLSSGAVLDVVWQPSARILCAISGDLYSYDPTIATSLARLTTSGGGNVEPSWSPDATHIAWTAGTSGKTAGIWIMNADGTGKQGPIIAKGRQGSWGK